MATVTHSSAMSRVVRVHATSDKLTPAQRPMVGVSGWPQASAFTVVGQVTLAVGVLA
jgi:hypothetical protein